MLRARGYDAIGIDPKAPSGPHYLQVDFEHAELPQQLDAVVASTSLHHVANPAEVIDRITSRLTSGGTVIILEWAWEMFDEPTAGWCFERLGPDEEAGWLHRRRDEWRASRERWLKYMQHWAKRERLHRGDMLVRLLDARLDRRHLSRGPYFFPDLADTTEADEQAAIDAGRVQATRIDYFATCP
jgi:SAM-dependent methyltransferase